MKKALKVIGLILIGFVLGIMFSPSDNNSSDTVKDVVQKEKVAKADTKPKEKAKPVEKAPTLIFKNDKVAVSFIKVDGTEAKLLIENKTANPVVVQDDSFAINGLSTSGNTFSVDIAPSSKTVATVDLSEIGDVGKPSKVSGKMTVNTPNFDLICDVNFTNIAVK